MCNQILSAAYLIDVDAAVTEKLLKSAICTAVIGLDACESRWKFATHTALGYQLIFLIPCTALNDDDKVTMDVVFTQSLKGTVVIASFVASEELDVTVFNEIYSKTQTVIETTMPLVA